MTQGGRRWLIAGTVAAVVIAAVVVVRQRTAPQAGGRGPDPAASRAVPVAVAPVVRRDVPVYLDGLGNVAANATVSVKTQVDGRLDAVLFREGQAVRRGDVLAQIDPRPFQAALAQAEGALARDQAQLRNAQLNVARDRQLVAEKLIAQQQLDTDLAAAGQLEGAVRMDQAAIETARLNLSYARIVSPIDGVTGIRQVDPGNLVRASDTTGIVVVTQIDPIAVIFTLPQDQLGPVAEQQARGPLPVEAFSRDGSTLLGAGTLAVIDNQINAATSTIRLKALLPNPRHALWPNQFVNARLRLAVRKGALTVPVTAVQRGPSGVFVYALAGDGTAAQRPVTLEATQGDLALVAKGLEEGDRVVVEGQNQLRPGAKVVPREAGAPAGRPAGGGGAPGAAGASSAGSAAPPAAADGKAEARRDGAR
jgi:multidrug efflux system membrane fusion protein